MQVRIRTTPGGIFGGMLAAAAVDNAGLVTPSTTTPAPSSTASAQASPAPGLASTAAAPAVVRLTPGVVKAPRGSGMRDGGDYILGIYIPPPGR